MSKLTTLTAMKKTLLPALFAAFTALIGLATTGVTAEAAPRTWSIVVHIEYEDGSVYEGEVATHVSTALMPSYIAACGQSHWSNRNAVRLHCFPVAE
jgi:hypothetical protein